jgi:predicted HicB family RNase H-like nuclease
MATYDKNKKSAEKYLATMERITIRVSKESGLKEAIQAHAERRGESVNAFILRAVQETMERDSDRFKNRRFYVLTDPPVELKYD